MPAFNLILQATDDGGLSTSANLTIQLEDVNDNSPIFKNDRPLLPSPRDVEDLHALRRMTTPSDDYPQDNEYSVVRIPESLPIGSHVTQVEALDADVGLFANIRYLIESQTAYNFAGNSSELPTTKHTNSFSINPKTGVITVGNKLLPTHFYILNVSAVDGGGLSSVTIVSIAVYDVNDHPPKFEAPSYSFNLIEGSYLVGEVGAVKASDEDYGINGEIEYQIILNDTKVARKFPFRIGKTSGMILAAGQIDREKQSRYQFSVLAKDKGDPSMSSSVNVLIIISDSNDHYPRFIGYQTLSPPTSSTKNSSTPIYLKTVPENVPVGTIITSVFANDSDSHSSGNGIVLYKIAEENSPLAIHPNNGSVYTMRQLSYDVSPTIKVTIIAQDVGVPSRSSTAELHLSLSDVKDSDRIFDVEEFVVSKQ